MKELVASYRGILPGTLIERLRQFAPSAEAGNSLCAEQLAIIHQQGWFKAFMPASFGGLEMGLPEAVRLEEALAYADGSVGWTVTLCAGAGLFVGFMDTATVPVIASPANACFGGSGQPLGVALARDGGYEISGQWPYATGLPHSTVVTANCRIAASPADLENPACPVRSFFFGREQVEMIADWDTMGLRGTGSHSFRVDRLWVPQSHAFDIVPEATTLPQPIYRYPFIPFSELTLAVNTLGMAVHLLELVAGTVSRRNSASSWGVWNEARDRISHVRNAFYAVVDQSWAQHTETGGLASEMEASIARVSRQVASVCQSEAARLYPHAGMEAAKPASAANRVWRDLFTASQHSMLRY